MKYKIETRCRRCKKLINETKIIDDKELAEKICRDAIINPLIGWCNDCDCMPSPKIIEIKEEAIK